MNIGSAKAAAPKVKPLQAGTWNVHLRPSTEARDNRKRTSRKHQESDSSPYRPSRPARRGRSRGCHVFQGITRRLRGLISPGGPTLYDTARDPPPVLCGKVHGFAISQPCCDTLKGLRFISKSGLALLLLFKNRARLGGGLEALARDD
jgi:hypothetical protein